MRSITMKLDETEFVIPALTIGQLQEVQEMLKVQSQKDPMEQDGFSLFKLCLKRATPTPDWENFAPTMDQIAQAIHGVFELSGLQKPDANPTANVVPMVVKS